MVRGVGVGVGVDRKSTRLNSSHLVISYAGFCLKKKNSVGIAERDGWLESISLQQGVCEPLVPACSKAVSSPYRPPRLQQRGCFLSFPPHPDLDSLSLLNALPI